MPDYITREEFEMFKEGVRAEVRELMDRLESETMEMHRKSMDMWERRAKASEVSADALTKIAERMK